MRAIDFLESGKRRIRGSFNRPQMRGLQRLSQLIILVPRRLAVNRHMGLDLEVGIRKRIGFFGDDDEVAGLDASLLAVDVLLRPDDVVHEDDAPLRARVVGKEFRGASLLYELELPGGTPLQAIVPSHHDHAVGSDIGIHLDAEHMVVFPAAGGDGAA